MIENLSKFFDSPIIYISSVSVYENTKKLYLNENMKLTKFNSKYAKVKKICEDKILSRNRFAREMVRLRRGAREAT